MTDSISNFIIQIQNASFVGKASITVPYSNLIASIAELLVKKGYVKSATKKGKKVQKFLEVELLTIDGRSRVSGVQRLSKPSKRLYRGHSEIYPVKQGYGTLVVSTPKGILSDDEARKEKVGGEILFTIW
ncbi:MAG: 30S ribosomal protein S8 [Candidatus Taylorbacteria bacterium CG10_big_fil_rev_8_21_14_0_10_41_48]|uniref:Small ribosomal subunit protein uS8 n=1 Tax=Candidatus Taylorbacteria bacterium CG10_big_fil_rev_8_21_14_0_10_41_48 TaxID=1975024 RepID=A0A2M8LCU1_9BACT|nr:MAG: 30S ribosomal protein S8 [Candidatus Taylorbacteria bacterium CG10_big_fil_rev_8_21_14_0_10_41_48]